MDHPIPPEVQDLADKIALTERSIEMAYEERGHAPTVDHYWHWCAERDRAAHVREGLMKQLRDQGWLWVGGALQKKEE